MSSSDCKCKGSVTEYSYCGHNEYQRSYCSSNQHDDTPKTMTHKRSSTPCPQAQCWTNYYATGGANNRQEGM